MLRSLISMQTAIVVCVVLSSKIVPVYAENNWRNTKITQWVKRAIFPNRSVNPQKTIGQLQNRLVDYKSDYRYLYRVAKSKQPYAEVAEVGAFANLGHGIGGNIGIAWVYKEGKVSPHLVVSGHLSKRKVGAGVRMGIGRYRIQKNTKSKRIIPAVESRQGVSFAVGSGFGVYEGRGSLERKRNLLPLSCSRTSYLLGGLEYPLINNSLDISSYENRVNVSFPIWFAGKSRLFRLLEYGISLGDKADAAFKSGNEKKFRGLMEKMRKTMTDKILPLMDSADYQQDNIATIHAGFLR